MAKYVKLNDLRSKAIKMFGFGDNKYVPLKAIESAAVEIKSYCVLDGVDDFIRAKEAKYNQSKSPDFYWADGEEECE